MQIDLNLIPTTLDAGHVGLAVLALLFLILFLVKSGKSSSPESNADSQPAPAQETPVVKQPQPKPASLKDTSPDAALQLLALLQQDARFLDFIQEDLQGFSDAEIGAAARIVHEGSKKTLNTYFSFQPIRSEDEESRVTIEDGFDASEIRLTGNVVGQAPFTGTLVHRGWQVTDVKLPKLADGHNTNVVAPAEVEL